MANDHCGKRNQSYPLVAVLGRANVGKSTLFNRLVGRRIALVHPVPGVTRDWRDEQVRLGKSTIVLRDTAGYAGDIDPELAQQIDESTRATIKAADVCLMMTDARSGIMPLEHEFVDILRRENKLTIVVANKCETTSSLHSVHECLELGMGEAIAISAEHGQGMGDLIDAIRTALESLPLPNDFVATKPALLQPGKAFIQTAVEIEPVTDADKGDEGDVHDSDAGVDEVSEANTADQIVGAEATIEENIDNDDDDPEPPDRPLRVAIIGRPNRGKSTLVNHLLGEDRMLVGKTPGVTRDTVGHDLTWRNRKIILFDTAGIRRQHSIKKRLEKLMVSQALRAIRFADVVVLLIEATNLPEKQELVLASRTIEEGRGLVVGLSKSDLGSPGMLQRVRQTLDSSLAQAANVPVVSFSALRNRRVSKLLDSVLEVEKSWNFRASTAPLNRWLRESIEAHPPTVVAGRRPVLKYITQIKARPPTFVLFCQRPQAVSTAYRKYLINGLRREYNLDGVPVRLLIKSQENPYTSD